MSKKTPIKKKGPGRPPSGRNTVTISFSVHKDFEASVKEAVRLKVAELKALQANPPDSAPKQAETKPAARKKDPVGKDSVKKVAPEIAPKQAMPIMSDFMKSRQKSKSG